MQGALRRIACGCHHDKGRVEPFSTSDSSVHLGVCCTQLDSKLLVELLGLVGYKVGAAICVKDLEAAMSGG